MKTKQHVVTRNSNVNLGVQRARPLRLWGLVATLLLLLFVPLALRAQTITWQEAWESPTAQDDWYADNGVWEIGVPTSGPPTDSFGWRAHEGTNCAATILNGNYPDGRESRLVSQPFLVPVASDNPRLRFWHWWSFNSYDWGQVQISTNNGASWNELSGGYDADSSGQWSHAWLNLMAYAGKTVRLGLYFHSESPNVSSGWYVDEIVLLATGLAPRITAMPTNLTVIAGSPASFTVASDGTPPLSYQWRFKSAPIQDATNTTYLIPSAQTNHEGGYDVVITNLYGAATSVPPAKLTVLVPPTITLQPQSQTVPVGSNVIFSVSVTGTPPPSYQWRANGANVPGATDSTLMLPNVQLIQSGSFFSVVVSNAAGSTNSADALLTVVPGCDAFIGHDVGDVGAAGSFSRTDCEFTVRGSGEDIEDTADAFPFVHQPWIGDGQIVARVLDLQGGDSRAEAGVMLRESLASGSRHVLLAVNSKLEATLRRRLQTDAYSVENVHTGTNCAWLRLMRMDNTFVGHVSTNGMDWEYVWHTTLNLPRQLEAGLAVTAHSNGQVATGQFDNVSLGALTPLPGPWPEAGPRIWLGGEPAAYPPLSQFGGFKLLIGGPVGDGFTVKASPDIETPFTSWSPLGTVTNTYGVVPFLDPQALTNQHRFYRLEKVGP